MAEAEVFNPEVFSKNAMNSEEPTTSSSSTLEVGDPICYKAPEILFSKDKDKILQLADPKHMSTWWMKELESVARSFYSFSQMKYFVNKCDFINVLLETTRRTAFFMPTGCSKTVMSFTLESYFSYKVSPEERTEMRKLYTNPVEEGKYYVIRISFRDVTYDPNIPFTNSLSNCLVDWVQNNEDTLINQKAFKDKLNTLTLFATIVDLIYQMYNKQIVLIIDEVDYPSNAYCIEVAGDMLTKNMRIEFTSILKSLSRKCTSQPTSRIARMILFGIHEPEKVLSRRDWNIYTCQNEDMIKFFMFTKEEVKAILEKHGLQHQMSAVEEHYGNYTGGFFSPASVVAYVNHGEFLLYKWCRRSRDVLDINMKSAESILSPFIKNEVVRKPVDTLFGTLSLSAPERCMLNLYLSAGLLCLSKGSKYNRSGVYDLTCGNLENLNIIAFFMERIIGKVSSQAKLDLCTRALEASDFSVLAGLLTEMFESFKPIELTSERCYQNPMKVFFDFVDYSGWVVDSEDDKGTANLITGDSGRTDLRLVNERLSYLYVLELKYIKGKEVTANPDKIQDELEKAFDQIIAKGYVTPKDKKKGFVKIYEVATVCHGKVVTMEGRLHEQRTES